MQVRGIIPPLVTPMRPDEEVDYPRLRQLIDHLIGGGVHGIFVLGTTGECYALDAAEKQKIVATTVEHVNKRVPVFAGTGAETTREAICTPRWPSARGPTGCPSSPRTSSRPARRRSPTTIAASPSARRLPVVLYSNPSTCGGLKIEPDTVARLAEVKNIVAIKDSSGDLQNLIETVRLVPDRLRGTAGPGHADRPGADVRGQGGGAGVVGTSPPSSWSRSTSRSWPATSSGRRRPRSASARCGWR